MSDTRDWGLLTAEHGAEFTARVDQVGRDAWKATAHVSLMRIRSILDDDIGPRTFASEAEARAWLEDAGRARGYDHVAIAVQPL